MAKPSTSLLKRRLDIAEIVRKNGEIKVDDLAYLLGVSGVTIRNDLNYLEQQGYLKRSFGGAIYTAHQGSVPSFTQASQPANDKGLESEMARQAAALIDESQLLYLGPGSILRKVIPFLSGHEDMRLLVNDLAHVPLARDFLSGEIILSGGVLGNEGQAVEGELTLNALQHFGPSCALFMVDHISEEGRLSVRHEASARLFGALINNNVPVIALVATRPVHGEKRYPIGEVSQIRAVITPQVVAAEYQARLFEARFTNSYTNNGCLTWRCPAS